ncbi:hypothetical protein [Mycolicibacterium llatzerense]|uniref:hypothetical protein n=1 Tax=Mycolicibacterium llatzerense TaxID=280871 RepID=UPI0021B617C8|nr:hypothetical protein [Mycolicibacterium llatzerense]MCT7373155.1 hypothetical protein [Mycolicibacterium llatzerense]
MAETSSESELDTGPLWAAGGAAALVAVAWTKRNDVLAALEPHGLIEPNRTPFHGDFRQPDVVTDWRPAPGWHVTTSGWIAAAVVAAGLLGLLVCVAAAVSWARWRRRGGVDEVPPVPALAAAAAGGAVLFAAAVLALAAPLWLAAAAATVAAVVTGVFTARFGRRQRTLSAFAGRADQVLGHGHPAAGRVNARQWQSTDAGETYPARIEAACGPGWQNTPGELAQLGRYARELGWPGYSWTYDPLTRRTTGVVEGGDAR